MSALAVASTPVFDDQLQWFPQTPICQKYSMNVAQIKGVKAINDLGKTLSEWHNRALNLIQYFEKINGKESQKYLDINYCLGSFHSDFYPDENEIVFGAYDERFNRLRSLILLNKNMYLKDYLFVEVLVSEPTLEVDHIPGGGSALLFQAKEECAQLGFKGLVLDSLELARPFYYRYGFTQYSDTYLMLKI